MPGSIDLETKTVTRVALLGNDYRGVNFELLCDSGDVVQAGAALMRDARRPTIRIASPAAGRVVKIERGARRKLVSVQIEIDDAPGVAEFDPPTDYGSEALRAFMLETGAWCSLRTRPFGNIPHPEAMPAALFVTALDSEPSAPQAQPIVDAYLDEFNAAVNALASIGTAPIYVCHAPGHDLSLGNSDRIQCVPFSGGDSAGLPGVHINALCPIGFAGGEVWHLGYQDAIALGQLLLQGSPWLQRVISLGGSAVENPRSLRVSPGASIDEILAHELVDAASQVLAGSSIRGRPVADGQAFLGAGQRQVTVLASSDGESDVGLSVTVPIIPDDRLERLAPPGILPVPLLRALQLGDAERARELGALELVEEDVAALSRVCASRSDYGLLLRKVLDQLEAAA